MSEILISEQLTGQAIQQLQADFDVVIKPNLWQHPQELIERVKSARALIVRNQTKVSAELIRSASELAVIGRAGVGVENIDIQAASDAGIVVCYAPEQNCISVAELTWGLILALARKIPGADLSTRAGKWDRLAYMGMELCNRTLGIIGLGRIGFLTAMRGRAFGMEILAFDPVADASGLMVSECGARLMSLEELLSRADVVSCHVPETPQTIGLLDYSMLCQMKQTALLINTSRGRVIDEPGLIRALKETRLAGAALDVRTSEPPAPSELSTLANVILTPHIGAFTNEGQDRVVTAVCRDITSVLQGGRARYPFNFAMPRRGAVTKG